MKKYNIKIERSTMKQIFQNLLFDLFFITAMIFNYYDIFQPISGNLCKCIPVYLGFAIILFIIAIILIFSMYVFSTKEEVQKAVKDYKPTNKIYKFITTLVIFTLYIMNGFIGNLILHIVLKLLAALLKIEIQAIKDDLMKR